MDVFGFGIVEKIWLIGRSLNLLQGRQDKLPLFARQHSRCGQSLRVDAAGRQFKTKQLLVERKRPLPLLELGV
jgi:hypothetical protein